MNNIQQEIDDAVEEFRKKLENALTKPKTELGATEVELINKELESVAYPVELFETGTLLNCGGWEAFCTVNEELDHRWVTFNGQQYSDGQFANLVRRNGDRVMVIHWGM
jgi:hypothetical protein